MSYYQDEIGDWVAKLACGHGQHIRHNPPFVQRPWVLTPEGRERFVGYELDCLMCEEDDETELPDWFSLERVSDA